MPRTILAHLNIELPEETRPDNALAEQERLARELRGALEVGTDPEQTPMLSQATAVAVTLVEEV